ncbi:MAG TPA: bifunctional DNA-formamidopyrimidine glycosylase/DNA-(apurinic or apyrimidinic site) lyase [Phycisphaerae bacterium]|nr:bifunctional DNA-formamidopyrimidine glycosylase/DNA-(apurinic or apyrimidinic site) lyase [Phycisphaerae bacterium]
MPELPEVEEVRRSLEPHVLNVPIAAVRINRPDFITPPTAPLQDLVGRRIVSTFRHGKKLFCIAADDQTLVIHLGMSGRIDCVPSSAPLPAHTHVIFTLASGTDVRLVDPRRFGGLWHYPTSALAKRTELQNLGKDALQLHAADLAHWRKTRGRLKQRLLSQKDVAGLGNIYVDESLWMSQLHPLQRVDRISPESIEKLVAAIHLVLERSINAGGTTLRDYRNVADQPGQFARQLQAYGHGGKPCLRCATLMSETSVAGRTTVFCRICQRRR